MLIIYRSLNARLLSFYTDETWHFYPDPEYLYPFEIDSSNEISVGQDGTVWMSVFRRNDAFLVPSPVASFRNGGWIFDEIPRSSYGVVADAQGRIWLINGYENNYFLNGQLHECQLVDTWIHIASDTATTVWAGDNEGNLYRFDGDCSWTKFDAAEESVGYIRAIAADDKYGVWVCGVDGVGFFDSSTWTVYDEMGLPFDGAANGVAIDNSGVAWFATDTGLYSFDGASWHTFTTANSLLPRQRSDQCPACCG